jgi:hypothetical protein
VLVLVDGLPIEEDKTNIFSVGASMKKSSQELVTRELFLFQRLAIPLPMCVDPLV